MEPILHYILKRLIYMQALDRCHPYILSDEINVRKRNETSIVIYNTVAYFGYERTVSEHIYNDSPCPSKMYNHASLAKHVMNESSF